MRFIFAFVALASFAWGCGKGSSSKNPPETTVVDTPKPRPLTPPVIVDPKPPVLAYPKFPELTLTPGSLCASGEQFRYAENIRYCERNVLSEKKNSIIDNYDITFGYRIAEMPRAEFKIDHFIPLCMGGSNEEDNLWPQHDEMFAATDKAEARLCDLMSKDKMKQAEAVDLIKWVKFNVSDAPLLMAELAKLMSGQTTAAEVVAVFVK